MADQDRTEKATPKHRKRARDKGEVTRSADLSGALVLVAGLMVLSITGPAIAATAAAGMREMLGDIAHPSRAMTAGGLSELMHSAGNTVLLTVGPIAAACLVGGADRRRRAGRRPAADPDAQTRLPADQPRQRHEEPARPQPALRSHQGDRQGLGRRGGRGPDAAAGDDGAGRDRRDPARGAGVAGGAPARWASLSTPPWPTSRSG